MRTSQYLLATVKETPADAELISHQLMFRAGLIRKLGAGLYTWLPTGLRVLRRIEHIVRTEMNPISQEILMPAVQPASLWEETGRWETFGPQLLCMTDRAERQYCFGPTHEEVITDLMRKELKSYKQLPACFYQIQTKFRDEIRPRFGVMRAREFTMKDGYSFHDNAECLAGTYERVYQTYCKILDRLGLTYRVVLADTGAIGGSDSHEFHVLAEAGEDTLLFDPDSDYAANVEKATTGPLPAPTDTTMRPIEKVATPGIKTVPAQAAAMDIEPKAIVKTLLVKGTQTPVVALLIRGDHTLNEIKAAQHPAIASPLTLATDVTMTEHTAAAPGFIGPIGLTCPIIADHATAHLVNFACGANETDYHYRGVNWDRDLPKPEFADLRNAMAGDPSPVGQGTLQQCRGIEVGHIFQLGQKYSEAMGAKVLNADSKTQTLSMGCYGMGISRLVAAAIEQHHDARGICWPEAMAPFDIALVPMQYARSERVRAATDALYEALTAAGFDVLLDDRKERPGVLFADMDLIGIPHRFVIGERGLDAGQIEYKHRQQPDPVMITHDHATLIDYLKQ